MGHAYRGVATHRSRGRAHCSSKGPAPSRARSQRRGTSGRRGGAAVASAVSATARGASRAAAVRARHRPQTNTRISRGKTLSGRAEDGLSCGVQASVAEGRRGKPPGRPRGWWPAGIAVTRAKRRRPFPSFLRVFRLCLPRAFCASTPTFSLFVRSRRGFVMEVYEMRGYLEEIGADGFSSTVAASEPRCSAQSACLVRRAPGCGRRVEEGRRRRDRIDADFVDSLGRRAVSQRAPCCSEA